MIPIILLILVEYHNQDANAIFIVLMFKRFIIKTVAYPVILISCRRFQMITFRRYFYPFSISLKLMNKRGRTNNQLQKIIIECT